MKVLHLVWNLIRGGTEGQCARVAMELARRGQAHPVMVFRREGYFLNEVERVCGPVKEIGIRGMIRPGTVWAVHRLARRLQREKIDVLHTWDADAAIFGQFAARWAGVKLITSRRDLGEIYPDYKLNLMARADREAVAVIANAHAIKSRFTTPAVPADKIKVIPNILDLDEFDAQAMTRFPRIEELPAGERVVMVTRLDPEKDGGMFIEAASLILKAHPGASFVIAGDGVERERLERMARTRNLSGSMIFLGDVHEVPGLLSVCRIGVLTPSRNEGLSNTLLEYMAAGLPVVATDCGGNRDLIQPDGGVIVPVGDAEALAHAVVDLLRKPTVCKVMGEFNRWQVYGNHQPKGIGDKFSEVYEGVM
ncbi:MAG TPA: glycosyltransferase [Kiritimatiellia bacterium]|nr:glycosyltransferase [Kiritimatiellia bacterium]